MDVENPEIFEVDCRPVDWDTPLDLDNLPDYIRAQLPREPAEPDDGSSPAG